MLPQALTAIIAASHTFGPSLGSGSSGMGPASTETSRKVPTPIQNALRVILSSVPLKTEQTSTSGGSRPPKYHSRSVQKSQTSNSGAAVKEDPEEAGTRSSPSRTVLADPGKIYSQLESLLCEEQLNLSKGGGEESEDSDKMVTDADEKNEGDVSSASPLRSLRVKTGQDNEAGGDAVGGSLEGGTSEGESGDVLSDAGKTISDLISRISRKRQGSPVRSSDAPPAKKKAVPAPATEGAVTVRPRVTVSPLVSRSAAATTSKVVTVATCSTPKSSVQASVKTSPAASRAISILRAVATNKATTTSSKATPTVTAKPPFVSKVPSPAKPQTSSPGVQVIPISSQTDPALSQAIETLNKALSSLNKAGISSFSAVSPSVKASAAAALISKKSSPLRSFSPTHRPQASTVVTTNPRPSLATKDVTQQRPRPSSSSQAQQIPVSQDRVIPIPQQPQVSLLSQQQLPPAPAQPVEPLLSKSQQPQKPLPLTAKQHVALPQQPPKPLPQQSQEPLPPVTQLPKEPLPPTSRQPQEQPLPHGAPENRKSVSIVSMDLVSPQQSQLPSSRNQQEMLSVATRLLQEAFPALSQAAIPKALEPVYALSQSGQQVIPTASRAPIATPSHQLGNVMSQQTVSRGPVPSQPPQETIPSHQIQDPLSFLSRPSQEPVLSRPSQEPVLSQPPQEPVLSQPPQEPVLSQPPQEPVLSRPPQEPVVSRPPLSHQHHTTAPPQQSLNVVLATYEQTKVFQSVASGQSQHYGPSIPVCQVSGGSGVQPVQAPEPAAQQQAILVTSQPVPASISLPLPMPSSSFHPLPTVSSQPCSATPPPLMPVVFSQQPLVLAQTSSTTASLSSESSRASPLLSQVLPAQIPPGLSAANDQSQPLVTFSQPPPGYTNKHEEKQQQLVVPSLSPSPPILARAGSTTDVDATSSTQQHPVRQQNPLPLFEPLREPVSVPLQPLLAVPPQVDVQQGSSVVHNMAVHQHQDNMLTAGSVSVEVEASSDSLNISDLMQDISDSTVSSLASQLAGLENAIPLLNMDFMAFLQPTTPDSPADSLPLFPPELPMTIESGPAAPSSTHVLPSHLDSPIIPTPLLLGPPPSLDDTLPSKTATPIDPSEPVLEISTLATSKDVSGASGSGNQGNPVSSSPAEYLDLDINSLMDPSKLLEGIPEDMAKSIQTIVQLDEETWK